MRRPVPRAPRVWRPVRSDGLDVRKLLGSLSWRERLTEVGSQYGQGAAGRLIKLRRRLAPARHGSPGAPHELTGHRVRARLARPRFRPPQLKGTQWMPTRTPGPSTTSLSVPDRPVAYWRTA